MFSTELVDHTVNAVAVYYMARRHLPKAPDIYAEHKDHYENVLQVAAIFEHEDFIVQACRRGIPWKKRKGLTTKQLLALQAVMNPGATGTLTARLRSVNVSPSTWAIWMKDPTFKSYYTAMGSSVLEEAVPMMKTSLANLATKGDLNAIKFAMEVTGEYNPANQAAIEVKAVLAAVVEIISKHVTDAETLTKIGFDLSALGFGGPAGNPRAIEGEVIGQQYDAISAPETSGERLSFGSIRPFE